MATYESKSGVGSSLETPYELDSPDYDRWLFSEASFLIFNFNVFEATAVENFR